MTITVLSDRPTPLRPNEPAIGMALVTGITRRIIDSGPTCRRLRSLLAEKWQSNWQHRPRPRGSQRLRQATKEPTANNANDPNGPVPNHQFLQWPASRRDFTSPLGRGRRDAAGEGGATRTNPGSAASPRPGALRAPTSSQKERCGHLSQAPGADSKHIRNNPHPIRITAAPLS